MPTPRETAAVSHYKKETLRLQEELTKARAAEMGFMTGLVWTMTKGPEELIELGRRLDDFRSTEHSRLPDAYSAFLPPTNELYLENLAREFGASIVGQVFSSPSLLEAFSKKFCFMVGCWLRGASEAPQAVLSDEEIMRSPEARRVMEAVAPWFFSPEEATETASATASVPPTSDDATEKQQAPSGPDEGVLPPSDERH